MKANAELFSTSFLSTLDALLAEATVVDRLTAGNAVSRSTKDQVSEIALALVGHLILADGAFHVREHKFFEALAGRGMAPERTAEYVVSLRAKRPRLFTEPPTFLDAAIVADADQGTSYAVRLVAKLGQLARLVAEIDGSVRPAEADAVARYGKLLLSYLQSRGISVAE